MRVLILLACVVAAAMADVDETCTNLRRIKVKSQWVQAYGSDAHQREEFGRKVFGYLFEILPKSKSLFVRVRGDNLFSPEFDAHMVRVLGGLDICISLLTEEGTLNAELLHLFDQHQTLGVEKEYFDAFETALWRAIPQFAPHFDQDAWHACYKLIADKITGTATV